MVNIFVQAEQKNGNPLIAEHYEFENVPREGEQIIVDSGDKQFVLKVTCVTHLSALKGNILPGVSSVTINCKEVN